MIEIIENKSNIEKTYDYDAFGNGISPDSSDTIHSDTVENTTTAKQKAYI